MLFRPDILIDLITYGDCINLSCSMLFSYIFSQDGGYLLSCGGLVPSPLPFQHKTPYAFIVKPQLILNFYKLFNMSGE